MGGISLRFSAMPKGCFHCKDSGENELGAMGQSLSGRVDIVVVTDSGFVSPLIAPKFFPKTDIFRKGETDCSIEFVFRVP